MHSAPEDTIPAPEHGDTRDEAGPATVTRITAASTRELPAAAALVEMTRDLMAAQARGEMPTIRMSTDGRITLRWTDDTFVSYLTGVDTGPVPRDATRRTRKD